MSSPSSPFSAKEVQDQVILPLRVALGICLGGIRTRLGRSAVTLSGVALGIAFLMAVLSGFHIQRALRDDATLAREVARRIAVLRSEVGTLRGKPFLVLLGSGAESDAKLVRALESQGAEVRAPESREGPSGQPHRDAEAENAAILLGRYEGMLSADVLARLRGKPIVVFERPMPEVAERVAAAGGQLRCLGAELRPDELARAASREQHARYRMGWIVAISLLITVGCIANAMLMSVTERFREIGTMKCLGALSSFVVKLFLIESLLLGLAGSLLGSVAGGAFSLLAYGYTFQLSRVLASVSFATLGLYGLASVLAGVALAIIAAMYPARVAAKMIPAAALASHV
jgi:hypothetical protein